MYTAVRGQGAYCNDEKITPSTVQGMLKTYELILHETFPQVFDQFKFKHYYLTSITQKAHGT